MEIHYSSHINNSFFITLFFCNKIWKIDWTSSLVNMHSATKLAEHVETVFCRYSLKSGCNLLVLYLIKKIYHKLQKKSCNYQWLFHLYLPLTTGSWLSWYQIRVDNNKVECRGGYRHTREASELASFIFKSIRIRLTSKPILLLPHPIQTGWARLHLRGNRRVLVAQLWSSQTSQP